MESVTFSESGGVRYLHFGTELIQGAMRIRDPDEIYLEYNQQMMAWLLFLETQPGMRIAQLGLGTGALTKFQHRYCHAVKTTVVELNPSVIIAARSMFFTPDDDRRLETLQADAKTFVKSSKYRNQFDAVQVDLYDAICDGPSASSLEFYKGCFGLLKSPGVMTVNLFSRHKSFDLNLKNICEAFDNRVLLFPESHDCNVVAIAFKGPKLEAQWSDVSKRAKLILEKTGLPTNKWVSGISRENARQESKLSI
ncbi:spermidine synthase [Polynucleobacter sp. AP-Melu-500A-A1]|uniref:spermine/spermidine synthase domain-containing protein n=1 Tax=Polynucleobacter sp. AP-Melu-500A-A1 TaxID=2576929 RepID=UPI001C0C86EE|nr:spermidine synthase [Polynucleobacter sp. AP-Melu-500A-A1]MBU3630272.1 spermidine synthase [Polynucleobacter sp. AP-Melu-500A-A1]